MLLNLGQGLSLWQVDQIIDAPQLQGAARIVLAHTHHGEGVCGVPLKVYHLLPSRRSVPKLSRARSEADGWHQQCAASSYGEHLRCSRPEEILYRSMC